MQLIRRVSVPLLSGLLLLSLSGCGTTKPERVTGGAALGATTGAVIGAFGGPFTAAGSALIGAAAGGGLGLITPPQEIDLGRPPFHRAINKALE
jgi:hypothetical protein